MDEMLMEKCQSCYYRGKHGYGCNYLSVVGHSRGCPVKGCTKYKFSRKRAKKEVPPPTVKEAEAAEVPESILKKRGRYDQRMELYQQGLTDPEIAGEMGISKGAIAHWRKALGLPSNYRREVGA